MGKQLDFMSELMPAQNLGRVRSAALQINVEMLTLAREAHGYTQKELADKLGCNQSRLSKIEAGELLPQENDVQNLTAALGLDRNFFFQKGTSIPASVSFYRKKHTLPLKMLRQCSAQLNVRRLQIEQQIGGTRLGKRELPYLPPEENNGAATVANRLRREWKLKPGPIDSLTKLVEDAGCVIVDFSFPTAKLDGLCVRAPEKAPIIFLNKDLPKSRRRLSLAHELGHLTMHRNPHGGVEDEAWDFAGEFLMPAAEIESELKGLNLDKLCVLKKKWRVSMQAILYRAKKLGVIGESYSRLLWMQIGKCGYRVNEPFEDVIPDEKPTELEKRLKNFS
jgi:Zn-dependent peptidase ImmA (M78 family)/DNA-binding XRE family transcriptional regulator